jgi:hypothetical protein
MRLTAFTLFPAQPEGYSARAATALFALPGVSDVLIGSPNQICSILFDEQRVSSAQLLRTLSDAGFSSELVVPASHGHGSCCGSCS